MKTWLRSPRHLLLGLVLLTLALSLADSAPQKKGNRRKAGKEKEPKDINVCDIEQADTPLYCYCNDNKLASAEDANCLIFNVLELADPIWAHFNSQMYIRKLSFVVRSDGSITYVPTAVLRQLKSLNTVSFQHARLTSIESQSFAGLHSVSTINLNKNNIQMLKWHAFESLRNLSVLNLDDNMISELSRDIFYDVPRLQKLFLNHNNITILHERAFAHLPTLQELELNNNKIAVVNPASFQDLRLLTRLDLRNNLIVELGERCFQEMPELHELDLDQNRIKYIANFAFDGLPNLKKLRLSENKLTTLEPDFLAGAPVINLLDLRDNALRTITFDNIKPIITNFYKNTSFIYLDDNKLVCDCKLTWIWGLRTETKNPKLREDLEELKCLLEASYETKFDGNGEDINRALEIVRSNTGGFHMKSGGLQDDSYPGDSYDDEGIEEEENLPVGQQTDLDGKPVFVKTLLNLKPDQLPCPSREDVMASEQPSGRRDHGSSSSIFSFVNGAVPAAAPTLGLVLGVALLVAKPVLFT